MVFDDKMTLFNSLNGSIRYRVCNNMTLQSSFKKGDPSPETLIQKKNNYSSVSPLLQKIWSSMPKLLYKYILKFFTIFFLVAFKTIKIFIEKMSIINNGNTKRLQVTKHLKKRSNSQKYTTNEYDFFWIRQDFVMIMEAIVVTTSFHR